MTTEQRTKVLEALSGFFDHVYVITLRRCVERQESMARQLADMPFEFFWAVDGKALSSEEIAQLTDSAAIRMNCGRDLSFGEIGCSLSHRYVCEDALRRGFSRVLVLEDDASLLPVGVDDVLAMLRELPAQWDLWYLGYSRFHDSFIARLVRRIKEIVFRVRGKRYGTRYTRRHSAHLRRAGFHNLSVAYAMTVSGCRKLVQTQTPVADTADSVMSHLCASRSWDAYISIPMIFEPNGMPTTIGERGP